MLQFQFIWIVFVYLQKFILWSLLFGKFIIPWKISWTTVKSWVDENKLSKIDINLSSDLYRIKYFSCIKQFRCINGVAPLYILILLSQSILSCVKQHNVHVHLTLSIMIVGVFSSCFMWSLCLLSLKSLVLYRLWHNVSNRNIRLLLPRMYMYN